MITVLRFEEAKPVTTPSVKRTPTTESLVELEGERRAYAQNSCGQIVVHVPGTSTRHGQIEGDSTEIFMSDPRVTR